MEIWASTFDGEFESIIRMSKFKSRSIMGRPGFEEYKGFPMLEESYVLRLTVKTSFG